MPHQVTSNVKSRKETFQYHTVQSLGQMSDNWADFSLAIHEAECLICRHKACWYLDGVTVESMDSVMTELKFLFTFVGYAHKWGDASPSSSSHHTKMDSPFIKVAAGAKELKTYLQHAFIDRFTDEPRKFTTKLANLGRSARHPFRSKASELIHVFTSLNQKIALLKPNIRAAYYGSLSSQSVHPQPPSSKTRTCGWNFFCRSLESNLQDLSDGKSPYLGDPLRKQMKALKRSLNSLHWLLTRGYCDWSPWKDNMMAHFGGLIIQVAYVCCFCWFARVDQSVVQNMAILLSDLCNKMDPDTPEFLEITLGFLGHYDEKYSERSISSFVYHILGVIEEREVLYKELVSLLTCLIKIPEMHDMDMHRILVGIKDVILESRYLKDKYEGQYKTHFAILFAKIWSLKAEIFIKSGGIVFSLSMDNHVKALHEGYRYLEQIFSPTEERSAEYQIVKLIEGVPKQVESLYQSSHTEDYSVHIKVSNFLFKSLVTITLLKAKALLLQLLEKDASLVLPLKQQIEILHEGLCFLIQSNINQPKEITKDEKLILKDIEVVAFGVTSVCSTFRAEKVTEEAVETKDIQLSDLLEKVEHLKAKIKGLYLQIPKFNHPKTPGLCFVVLLLQKLRKLHSYKHDSVAYATHQIEAICRNLEFIVSTFQDIFEQDIEKQECKDLHTRLVDVAYQVEHVIDSMLGENKAVWQHSLWLYHLSEGIRHIKLQLANFDGNNNYDGVYNVPQRLVPVVSQVTTATIEELMIGLNDQKEEIIGRLTRGTLQRDIVSIVGMPGIGKTTLANNLFCSPSIMYHFHIRAWCCVSQKYKKRDLLLDILSHILTITDNTLAMSDADLDLLLYKQLKGKRYIIIMDDIWSTTAWDDLQQSFPDDSNGSRILLTSRLQNVVSKISDPHPLRLLSEEESWELLKLKIFWKEEFPEELLEVGQKLPKVAKDYLLLLVQ